MTERILAGRYRLDTQIAAGGMGTVWRAHDEVLQRSVAVKLLHDGLSGDAGASERFRREALMAAQLTHPNMAGVFDYIEEDGRPGIVMELVDGDTLGRRLAVEGPLPVAEAIRIAADVLSALQAAHDAGVVHRDVKPANVLLTQAGAVKVSDFGIARSLGDAGLTATGNVMGTAHYSAPEQVRGAAATPATDIYAVGVMLFEMLTGKRPFEADTAIAVAMARLEQDPPAPRSIRGDIPPALDAVVMRALAREPEGRFASASEMREALLASLGRGAALPQTEALVFGPSDPTIALRAANGAAYEDAGTDEQPAIAAYVPPRWAGRRLATILLPALLIGLLTFWIVAALRGGDTNARATRPTTTASARPCCSVPELRGKTVAQAQDALRPFELTLDVGGNMSSTARRDTIVRQTPAAATTLARGGTVVVWLSSGPPPPDPKDDGDEDKGGGKGKGKGDDD